MRAIFPQNYNVMHAVVAPFNQQQKQQHHHRHRQHWRTHNVDSVWCKNVIWYKELFGCVTRLQYHRLDGKYHIIRLTPIHLYFYLFFRLPFLSLSVLLLVFFALLFVHFLFVYSVKCYYDTVWWKNSHLQNEITEHSEKSRKFSEEVRKVLHTHKVRVYARNKHANKSLDCLPKVLLAVKHFS